MSVSPWTPPPVIEDDLAAPVLRAELAGLDVIVPALKSGDYDAALSATGRMGSAVAGVLTDKEIEAVWRSAAERSATASRSFWMRQARRAGIAGRVSSPDLPPEVVELWRRENERRFAALRDDVAAETRAHLKAMQARGMGPTAAAHDVAAHGLPSTNGRMRGRAVVIANDQQLTLAGMIARHQQLDAGITSFVWRTREDSRVRDAHDDLNRLVFEWARPPAIGIPGQPINCRCYALGVVVPSDAPGEPSSPDAGSAGARGEAAEKPKRGSALALAARLALALATASAGSED